MTFEKRTSDLLYLCRAIFNRNLSVNENHVFRAFASGLQTGRSLPLPLYKPESSDFILTTSEESNAIFQTFLPTFCLPTIQWVLGLRLRRSQRSEK